MVERWKNAVRRLKESLAVRNGEDNGPTKKEPGPSDVLLCDGEPPPSIEEIQSWGKSFDKLMRSTAGRKVFRDFLRCEYSEENILFWLACEELKRENNPDAVEEKARFIYEDYISILSPKEVSLDSRVREVVNRNMVEPTPHTFDEAQLQIYTLMHRDSYPRFVNSALYKTLAQVACGSVSGGAGSEEEPGSPDSTKRSLSEGRVSNTDRKDDPPDLKAGDSDNKQEADRQPEIAEKKEIIEKKGVTWEKLEEIPKSTTDSTKKQEIISNKKEDKKEVVSEKANTEKQESSTQSLLDKKDFDCSSEKKATDKKEESGQAKRASECKKDSVIPNNAV